MTTLTVVRAGLLALTIVTLGFVPGVSVADPPSATDHASVTGHGDFLTEVGQLRFFSFHAFKDADGKVTGQAEVRKETPTVVQVVHMDIDCLKFLDSKTVRVSGKVKQSNQSFLVDPVAMIGVFLAQDNGEGAKGANTQLDGPDRVSNIFFFNPMQNVDCNSSLTLTSRDVKHGNIQVRP